VSKERTFDITSLRFSRLYTSVDNSTFVALTERSGIKPAQEATHLLEAILTLVRLILPRSQFVARCERARLRDLCIGLLKRRFACTDVNEILAIVARLCSPPLGSLVFRLGLG